jgi:two-component system, OmpR family, phosphate regulon sensor histidine kinase PhoR
MPSAQRRLRQWQQRSRSSARPVRADERVRYRTGRQLHRSQALAAVARAVARIESPAEWGARAVVAVEEATGWHRLFLFRLGKHALETIAARGITPEEERRSSRRSLDGLSLSALAVRRRAPIVVGRIKLPTEVAQHIGDQGIRSYAVFPLMARGRIHGTLTLLDTGERVVDDEEFDFLRAVADALAVGMAREELYATAEASRLRLRAIFEQMADGVLVFDPQGRFVEANAVATRLVPEVATDEGNAFSSERLDVRHVDGSPMPVQDRPSATALRSGKPVVNQNLLVVRPDGTRLELSASAAPVYDDSGQLLGAVTTLRDVTELRRLERAKDTFLSVASHELRTPLTPLKGLTQSLLRQFERADATGTSPDMVRVRRYLRTMDGQVDQLAGLVNDLLDVSRIRTGRLQLNLAEVDLVALVNSVLARFEAIAETQVISPAGSRSDHSAPARPVGETERLSAGAAHHIVRFQPGSPELIGQWDAARLEQVITNLVANSLKYTPAGGEIDIILWQETSEADPQAHLAVHDPGIGIPPEQLSELFLPFHRLANAPAEHFGGLGLGLYISGDIVARHGGRIWAESAGHGQGATFHVVLPLVGAE